MTYLSSTRRLLSTAHYGLDSEGMGPDACAMYYNSWTGNRKTSEDGYQLITPAMLYPPVN